MQEVDRWTVHCADTVLCTVSDDSCQATSLKVHQKVRWNLLFSWSLSRRSHTFTTRPVPHKQITLHLNPAAVVEHLCFAATRTGSRKDVGRCGELGRSIRYGCIPGCVPVPGLHHCFWKFRLRFKHAKTPCMSTDLMLCFFSNTCYAVVSMQ